MNKESKAEATRSGLEWIDRARLDHEIANAVREISQPLTVSGLESLLAFIQRFKAKESELKPGKK